MLAQQCRQPWRQRLLRRFRILCIRPRHQPIGSFEIPESARPLGSPHSPFPYHVANSFGPTYIHSYIIPENTGRLYCDSTTRYDLPAIAPISTPPYKSPELAEIGQEPRQPLHCFFTVGQDERCDIRVRGFNHDVSQIPGVTDTIPDDCEPAADEIEANWTDNNPLFGERPGLFILPVTL